MAFPGPPRRSAGVLRIILLTIFVLIALYYFRSTPEPPQGLVHDATGAPKPAHPATPLKPGDQDEKKLAADKLAKEAAAAKTTEGQASAATHPIDTLIEKAEKEFAEVLKKETHDLKSAAKVYRERRGRHPPPGFDDWFKFAKDNNAVIVEDFFDQIYHDLTPFWGLSAPVMRKEGWDHEMVISVRDKKATSPSDWFWTLIWLNMTQSIEHLLPDLDFPINAMDEPRIVVPWEKMNEYMEHERKGRAMPPAAEVVSTHQKLPPPKEGDHDVKTREKNWENTRKNLISRVCVCMHC